MQVRRRLVALGVAVGLLVAGSALMPAQARYSFEFTRLAGSDRYATAAVVAQSTFPTGADTVLLANGLNFPDAIAANYLAGFHKSPTLLTLPDSLPGATKSALSTLKTKNVVILGGPTAVSAAVESELKATNSTSSAGGKLNVTRIQGADRWETARLVAETPPDDHVGTLNGKRTGLVASGENDRYADALAGGPLAYAAKFPVLPVQKDLVPVATEQAASNLNLDHVIILGGTDVVSDTVKTRFETLGMTTERIAGLDRTETATKLADFALSNLAFSKTHVELARGNHFADALTGGPHGGVNRAPILLTSSETALGAKTEGWLNSRRADLAAGHIFGGTTAVSAAVEAAAEQAAGAGQTDATYAVSPEVLAAIELTKTRACTATVPNGTTVDIRLVPSSYATLIEGSGEWRFQDADGNYVADTGSPGAVITRVENTDIPADDREAFAHDVVSDGSISFTISSSNNEQVVAVVWKAEGVADNDLDLDPAAGPGAKPAAEPFGVGCRTQFVPQEAASGDYTNLVVDSVIDETSLFTADTDPGDPSVVRSFYLRSGDTFRYQGTGLTRDQLLNVLSPGDTITVNYTKGGTSTHNLQTDHVGDAQNVRVQVARANGDTWDDAMVLWSPSDHVADGVVYEIIRTRRQVNDDGSCTPSGSQLGTLGNPANLGTTTATAFVDVDPGTPCFTYTVKAINPTTFAHAQAVATNPGVILPQSSGPDTSRPKIRTATATDTGFPGVADATDQHVFNFEDDTGMHTDIDADGSLYRVQDEDGSVGVIRCGTTGNASCSLGADGLSSNRRLTVTLTGTPTVEQVGSVIGFQYPLTVISVSHHWKDAAGNPLDLAGSADRVLG